MKFENNSFVIYLAGSSNSYLVSDIDSIIFKQNTILDTVNIGSQLWMKKNLDVAFYRNGDPIPQVTDSAKWANLTTGAWCYYNNDSVNGETYGKLYNWYAVHDPRGLAPIGYRVPDDLDWTTLITNLGGLSVAGGKMKEAGTIHWTDPNQGATNSSGFTGLAGGYRDNTGNSRWMKNLGYWWSATEDDSNNARNIYLIYYDTRLYNVFGLKGCGYSVRCIKENVDFESVTIGTQVWNTKNLDVTYYRNGDVIPQVTDSTEWANLTTGAWCYYNNDPAYGAIYGKLYNWYAVHDSRGMSPLGWHIPSDAEFTTLSTYLGGDTIAGGKLKETGTTHWSIPNTGATNETGFSFLPGGYRSKTGSFASIRDGGVMWSTTEENVTIARNRILNYFNIIMYMDKSCLLYTS